MRSTHICEQCGCDFVPFPAAPGRFCSQKCLFVSMREDAAATFEQRFWQRVQKTDTCWLWQGAHNNYGYGVVKIRYGNPGVRMGAHRVSYQLSYGTIPEGLLVCHRCDTPACVRPDHLFLGTQADNVADKVQKGRQPRGKKALAHTYHRGESHWAKRHPEWIPRGEQRRAAKLTEAQVHAIVALLPLFTHREIAELFHVHPSTITKINGRKNWKHIT